MTRSVILSEAKDLVGVPSGFALSMTRLGQVSLGFRISCFGFYNDTAAE